MGTLRMETDAVRTAADQICSAMETINSHLFALRAHVEGMDWVSPGRNQFVDEFGGTLQRITDQTETGVLLATRLSATAEKWEQMAARVDGGANGGFQPAPTPVPTPTPAPTPEPGVDSGQPASIDKVVRDIFDFFENLAKPIGWIGDNAKASKQFHEVFQGLGRILNQLGDTRGYIKQLDGLATMLEGGADAISSVGDLVSANDFRRYFNGEMTNAEIVKTACSNIPPIKFIPFLGEKIAQWLLPYLSDPNGKWKGLVPPAYSE